MANDLTRFDLHHAIRQGVTFRSLVSQHKALPPTEVLNWVSSLRPLAATDEMVRAGSEFLLHVLRARVPREDIQLSLHQTLQRLEEMRIHGEFPATSVNHSVATRVGEAIADLLAASGMKRVQEVQIAQHCSLDTGSVRRAIARLEDARCLETVPFDPSTVEIQDLGRLRTDVAALTQYYINAMSARTEVSMLEGRTPPSNYKQILEDIAVHLHLRVERVRAVGVDGVFAEVGWAEEPRSDLESEARAFMEQAERALREAADGQQTQGTSKSQGICVVFFSSNPDLDDALAVDVEYRRVRKELEESEQREIFRLEARPDVYIDDLAKDLRRLKKKTAEIIVHFSGHGAPDGQLLMRDTDGNPLEMDPDGVAAVLSPVASELRLLVLNACYSEGLAERLVDFVDCVVGMSDAVMDDAASAFSKNFYSAIFDGETVSSAFATARAVIQAQFPDEEKLLQLKLKDGVDAGTVRFPDSG